MKKVLALLMAAIMMLSLAACGGSNDQPAEDDTPVVEEDVSGPAAEGEGPAADDMPVVDEMPAVDAETPAVDGESLGNTLLKDFEDRIAANPDATAQELADGILTNSAILFSGASMPVEPGYLTGFDETEITGFEEGVMFAPMIGTIPFVGYVFTVEGDVDAFAAELESLCDLRWNICTEAEEAVIGISGDKVFFVMSVKNFEA